MSIAIAILFFGVIVAIFIFDFYQSYTGPGTYALRKLTSGKFPPSKPTFLQGTVTAFAGLAFVILGILIFWGLMHLGHNLLSKSG